MGDAIGFSGGFIYYGRHTMPARLAFFGWCPGVAFNVYELISHDPTSQSCFMHYHKRARAFKSFKAINIVTDYVYALRFASFINVGPPGVHQKQIKSMASGPAWTRPGGERPGRVKLFQSSADLASSRVVQGVAALVVDRPTPAGAADGSITATLDQAGTRLPSRNSPAPTAFAGGV